MFLPLLGRHLAHSMVVFYTALVCTSIVQTSLLGMSVPRIRTDWLPHQAFDNFAFQDVVDFNKTKKSLALLYPPGIVGGYRNQVMRLIGFLQYAKRHDVEEILLPTMLWSKFDSFCPEILFPPHSPKFSNNVQGSEGRKALFPCPHVNFIRR
jgi:hypothetical protein